MNGAIRVSNNKKGAEKEERARFVLRLSAIKDIITRGGRQGSRGRGADARSTRRFLSLIQSAVSIALSLRKVAQNFMAWGLSLLVREKRALKYCLSRGVLSALRAFTMAPSTVF